MAQSQDWCTWTPATSRETSPVWLKEPPQKAGTPVNTPGRRQISRVSLHEEVDNRLDVTNIPTVPGRQSRVRQEWSRE